MGPSLRGCACCRALPDTVANATDHRLPSPLALSPLQNQQTTAYPIPSPLSGRRSLESLQENAARLKAYKSNLVIFPRNAKKPKAFETAGAGATAQVAQVKGTIMPIVKAKAAPQMVKITAEMKAAKVSAPEGWNNKTNDMHLHRYRGGWKFYRLTGGTTNTPA